jgi:hypothetical protein
MSPRSVFLGISALLVLTLTALAALFVVQNSGADVQLTFELPLLGAWNVGPSLPVIGLVGGAFGGGFGLATVLFGTRAITNGRRARQLEQEMALAAAMNPDRSGDKPGWR